MTRRNSASLQLRVIPEMLDVVRRVAESREAEMDSRDGRGGPLPSDRSEIHVDHVTPVAAGGTGEVENLQAACRGCNLAKGRKVAPPGQQGRLIPL